MKILIISGAFYPQNSPRAFRTTELAKELIRLGHAVTVYVPEKIDVPSEFLEKHPLCLKHFRDEEGRRFTGISVVDRVISHVLHRFFAYPALPNARRVYQAVKAEAGHDLLITIAVPHFIHWAVGKLYAEGKHLAKQWIADCGDPFMLAQSGAHRPPFYFKGQEKRWCRMCDFITVPIPEAKNGYYPEFRDKIRVIPQGFDFSEVKTETYTPNAVPTFAYSGVFIPGKRDLRPVLDELMQRQADFALHVYTRQAEMFKPYQEKLQGKLFLHQYIPRLELLKTLSKMDFLLNLENGVAVQTPSKLIDYALTGRPILSLDSSRLDTDKLASFLHGDYSRQYHVENLEQYNIKNVTQQFLELVRSF